MGRGTTVSAAPFLVPLPVLLCPEVEVAVLAADVAVPVVDAVTVPLVAAAAATVVPDEAADESVAEGLVASDVLLASSAGMLVLSHQPSSYCNPGLTGVGKAPLTSRRAHHQQAPWRREPCIGIAWFLM